MEKRYTIKCGSVPLDLTMSELMATLTAIMAIINKITVSSLKWSKTKESA